MTKKEDDLECLVIRNTCMLRLRSRVAPAAALMAVIVLGLGSRLWDRQRLATGAAPVDARALLWISATSDAMRGPEPSTSDP